LAEFKVGCSNYDFDHHYRIYVVTHLGLGSNEARCRYEAELLATLQQNSSLLYETVTLHLSYLNADFSYLHQKSTFYTHADVSRGSKAFSCVCLSVCPHDKTKVAETKITKHGTAIVYEYNIRSKDHRSRSRGHKVQKRIMVGMSYALC